MMPKEVNASFLLNLEATSSMQPLDW